ncbi:hypothetical protein [Paenibacillus contaminans]|uniref:Uncharacterized protein n=1 Tax=Paenibacillus contaminans TaxID=450362 RepID=A0A329MPE2_9BACL|nr:hypothetical protein [Paenibacillus contaminans]RAV21472.1 hypothetical protein DQG23_09350 [Paenibacillus contaminans]
MEKVSGDDISKLLGSIKAGSCEVEDKLIIEMIGNWIPSYNCEAAADGFLEVIPIVISSRPHLERELLKIAIRPMFYMGISESKQVFEWVDIFLKNERNSFSEECAAWFKKELTEEKEDFITVIIQEIQKEEGEQRTPKTSTRI